MDVKSAFLYGRIEEEVYLCQPSGFEDHDYPDKVYKVEKALYGLHQAPKAWYETLAKYHLDNRFCKGKIDQTCSSREKKRKKELCTEFEDKYIDEILRKFKYEDVKPVSTPMDKEKALLKDSYGDDVDVHLYRSMIGSLMYLTSSRPDTMFAVCTCAKFQVTPKVSHLHAVKRIFRYLKGHPKLGLWHPRDLSFDLVTYTNSDYAEASLDRKSTSRGCEAHHIWLSLILGKKMIKYELSNGLLSYSHNRPKPKTLIKLYTSHKSLMANLEFCDKHNMVVFLKKPQRSEDFHKIVDFLKASHIRTLDNGEIELNATVNGHDKTIIKASSRRHLKLADAKIFKQLALMGNIKRESRGFSRVETTLFPTMLVTEQVSQGEDEAITKEMHDGLGRATNTVSRLEAEEGISNISKTQTKATPSGPSSLRTSSEGGPGCHFTMRDSPVQDRPERLSNFPNEPPLGEGNTSQSEEGSIQLLELMDICTKLSDKVRHLENELTSTKAVYNKALVTLTKRVKKLEKKLNHKRRRVVIDSLEEEKASLDHEDSPKQERMIKEIDKEENVNLVKSSEQEEAHEIDEHIMDFSTTSPQTDDDETLAETLLNIKRSATKDKGKAIMQESESLKKIKKKEMMQISLDEEIAQRFYEEDTIDITRRFVPMESKGQAVDSKAGERSSKAGKSLKRSTEEELGQQQKVEEEISLQEDVVAKQDEKESSKWSQKDIPGQVLKSATATDTLIFNGFMYKGKMKRLILTQLNYKEGLEMERITPLDLLSMMKRQHALSHDPSLLLQATSTITSTINILAKGGMGAVGNVYSDGEDLWRSGITCDGCSKLINDIEAGKHDKLLFEMTNDDRIEIVDALGTICKSIHADNNNADVIPYKKESRESPSDPIFKFVDINTKSTSYTGAACASAKDQLKVNSNFRTLVADPVFGGVNISIPRKVVKKGRSSFAWCLIKVNSEADLIDIVTIGILSLSRYGFTKEIVRVEYEWRPLRCDICKKKKRKGKSKSTNGG
nr:hypothetical protein [Tanacetum cinerariifolium]